MIWVPYKANFINYSIMKKLYILIFTLLIATVSFGQAVFINEIHYDNVGQDVDEGFEIAGPAGTDLSTYHVTLYSGNGGFYDTIYLYGTIPNENSSGYGAIWFGNFLSGTLPSGLALDNGGTLIQFLSYGGSFIANAGPAYGVSSTDIGVAEWITPIGNSIQLIGYGTDYTDFWWYSEIANTPNLINTGQFFGVTEPTLLLEGLPPSGSTIEVGPEDLNGELEYVTTNFTVGEPGTGTEGDGYITWSILNITDGGVLHDNGSIYDSSIPTPFITLLPNKQYYLFSTLVANGGAQLGNPESTYTLTVNTFGYNAVADITALRAHVAANGDGLYYEITGASLVNHTDHFQNRKWLQDSYLSGMIILDYDAKIATTYNVGDKVTGLKGQALYLNDTVLNLLPSTDSGVIMSSSNPVIPQVVTIPDFNSNYLDYESEIIELQDVTIDEGNGVAVFNPGSIYHVTDDSMNTVLMYIDYWDADHIGTVIPKSNLSRLVAVAGHYNGEAQIYPRSLNDFTLDTENYESTIFSVYPNPTSYGYVNISSRNQAVLEVGVFDIMGKRILQETVNHNLLDVSTLTTGIYILKISQDNSTTNKKLVIK